MEWILILGKAFWCGFGAVGFGILFNVPPRTLFALWVGGAIGGFLKFSLLQLSAGVVFASFVGASFIGILSIPIAHFRHVPPMIFSIPSVIPLIPGVFAYRTMLGLIKLTGSIGPDYSQVIADTVNNGVKTLFIIMSLAVGVAVPMHLMRKESVKNIRLKPKAAHD
ncbi:MAG: threonine/serine exporter family protein [Bacteroidota bacterium]|nr:threonine/serine exporter family protein [Bacteroidota bacterium]